MHSQITLTIIDGCLQGKEIVLDRRGRYVVGRAPDCDVQLALGEGLPDVSRHHFLLAFDPPMLRVRDLGSRNGTFLNGENIGHRSQSALLDGTQLDSFAEYEVYDGDELRVQDLVFRVAVHDPTEVPVTRH